MRGGPPTAKDRIELAKFYRFLTEPLSAWLPEWRPYMAGKGDPPGAPVPPHGGYPGKVVAR